MALLLLLIICISTVSATDNSTDTDNEINIEKTANNNIYEKSTAKTKTTSLSKVYVSTKGNDTNKGTKKYPKASIESALDSVKDGGKIYLENGTYRQSRISINKNVTLLGESSKKTIINSMHRKTFTIHSNVIIKSVTIKNAKDKNGGAIYNNGTLKLEQVNIKNSSATAHGGAVYNNGNLTIIYSTFSYNSARMGASIYNKANLTAKNTNYSYNTALNTASAIYTSGTLNIANCKFYKNNKSAVYISKTDNKNSITHSIFHENTASIASAVTNKATLRVTNTTFQKNTAKNGAGIYSTGKLNVKDSTFKTNTANRGAGIYSTGPSTINNSTFTLNKANNTGSAVYSSSTLNVNGCKFASNVASAITSKATLKVTKTTFQKNTANAGSGIYAKNVVNINNCNFTKNNNTAVYIYHDDTSTIRNSKFTSNTATNGGAVYNRKSKLKLSNTRFYSNTANRGAGVYNTGTITLNNNTFSSNRAVYTGSALYSRGKVFLNTNTKYSKNSENRIFIAKNVRQNTVVTANSTVTSTDSKVKMPVKVCTDDGQNVIDGKIHLYLDGKLYKTKDLKNSKAIMDIKKLSNGTHKVKLVYDSNYYNKSTALTSIRAISTTRIVVNPSTYNYGESMIIPFKVYDSNNNEVESGSIKAYHNNTLIYGSHYEKYGSKLVLNNIPGGVQEVKIVYESTAYCDSNKTFTITINKIKSNIFAEDLQAKAGSDIYIPVNVTDELNNTIREGTVSVYCNSQLKASANANSIIKLSPMNVGVYTLNVEYTSTNYNTATKTIILTVNPVNKYSIRLVYNPSMMSGLKTKFRGLVRNPEVGTINYGYVKFYFNNEYVGTEDTRNNLSTKMVTPVKSGYTMFKVEYYNSNNIFECADTRLLYVRPGEVQRSQDTHLAWSGDLIDNSLITSSKKDIYIAMDRTTGDTNYSPNDMKIMNNIAANLEANGFRVKVMRSGPGETYELARYMYKNNVRNSICFILCNGVDANVIRQYFKGNDNMITTVRNRGNDIVMGWFYGAGDIYNPDGEFYHFLPKAWDDNYSGKSGMAYPRRTMENNGIKIVFNRNDLTGQETANSLVKLYGGKITTDVTRNSALSLKISIRTSNSVNGNLVYTLNDKVINNISVTSESVNFKYTMPNVAGTYKLKVAYYVNNNLKCTTFDRYIRVTN